MKTDLYTKIILTIIAFALVGNLIKDINFVSTAQAEVKELEEFQDKRKSPRSVKKELEDDKKKKEKKKEKEVLDVNIVQVNGREIGHEDSKEQIPVYIKNSAMPVYFKGIPFVKVSNYYDFVPNNGTVRKK